MKNHHVWMLIGCLLPLALIFFLPLFGAGGGELLFLFIILCFGIHLLMMGRHPHNGNGGDESQQEGEHHGDH